MGLIINGNCNAGGFMTFKENFYTKNLKKESTKYYAIFQFCCLEGYLLVNKIPCQCNNTDPGVILFTEIVIDVL